MAVAFVGSSLAAAGCDGGHSERGPDPHELVRLTTPANGRAVDFSGVQQTRGSGFRASWRVEAPVAWDAYCDWVEGQLAGVMKRGTRTDSTLTLRKSLSGDAFVLTIETSSTAMPLRVDVVFMGYPY